MIARKPPDRESRAAVKEAARARQFRIDLRYFAVFQLLLSECARWWLGWQGTTWPAAWLAAVAFSIGTPLLFSFTRPVPAARLRERLGALSIGVLAGSAWSGTLSASGMAGTHAATGVAIGVALLCAVSVAALACTRAQALLGYGLCLGLLAGFGFWAHNAPNTTVVPVGGALVVFTAIVAWVTWVWSSAYSRQLAQSLEMDEQSAVIETLAGKVSQLLLATPPLPKAHDTMPGHRPSTPFAACSEAFQTAIVEVTPAGELVYLNAMARDLCDFHGKPDNEPIDGILALFADDEPFSLNESVAAVAANGCPLVLSDNFTLSHRDAEHRFTVKVQVLPCPDAAATNPHVLIEMTDLTEFHSLSQIALYHDTHDPLTGLPNRRTFMRHMHEVTRQSTESTPSAICFIDLDHLDIINDTCGHAAGDSILRQVAHRLAQEFRATDNLTRVGGDQFAALLENCNNTDALRLAEHLVKTVRNSRFEWNERRLEISASVGVADNRATLQHYSDPFSAAHAACREARRRGGNQAYLHDEALRPSPRAAEVATWIERLREAIHEDRFQLQVQPIVPLDPNSDLPIRGELLVRIVDESGEVLAPREFILAAEHYDIMPDMDRWVVEHAIDAMAADEPALAGLARCAINLSGQSLGDPTILSFIIDKLDRSGVDADRLSFEITETAVVANFDAARHFINTLTERGCHFSLDDFGTGFSSLLYVKNLPVETIKIDGAFVRDLAEDQIDQALVSSIREMGHLLGMRVVAEHVESQEVLDWLRRNGVDYGQGTLLGEPRPIS